MPEVTAIVLAAGAGTRIGMPKARLRIGERSFLEQVVHTLGLAGLGRIVVVLGAQAAAIRAEARLPASVSWAVNERWREGGMLSSLLVGLDTVGAVSGVLVWPVDHPTVGAATVRGLVGDFTTHAGGITVPVYAGRRGHPALFGAELFGALRTAPATEGARAVMSAQPQAVREVPLDDPGVLRGIDRPEDWAALEGA